MHLSSSRFNRIIAILAIISTVSVFAYRAAASSLPGAFLGSKITVGDTNNTYAIADANYLEGGHQTVATHAALLTITRERREVGMLVTVVDDDTGTVGNQTVTYRLISNPTTDGSGGTATPTTDANWTVVIPSLGGNSGKFLTTDGTTVSWATVSGGGGGTYTAGTGLTLTGSAFSVNTSQNIATLSNLTTDGFVRTSGANGTLSSSPLASSDVTTALGFTPGTGTVMSLSVVTANGFAGSVTNASSTPAITITTNVTGLLKGNGTAVSAATADVDYTTPTGVETITNKDLTSGTNTFPTFNQNTTGSAAKLTTARLIAGNSFDGSANVPFANKFIVQGTSDAGLSGAQFLGALGTGLLKNTTTTGVLSTATPGTDYEVPLTFSTGLTRTTNTITVNTSQNINTLSNLTANGFVTTSGGTGALSVTGSTGSGNVVLASSPTLVTPTLGAATATSINGLTITSSTGTLAITNGKTLTANNSLAFSGTDGSTLNVGTGGTLGSAAYTNTSAYEVPLTFSTGLTRTVNTVTVNTIQNITTLSNLTTNGGIVYTNGSGVLAQTGAGSSTTVLHGGTTPSYSAVALGTDVSGTLGVTNGGTGTNTSFTQGSVPFIGASGVYSQNNNNFYFQNSATTPTTLATNTNVALSVNTNGDFTGTDAINVYGQYDAYLPNSAITNSLTGLNTDGAVPGYSVSSSRGTGASPAQLQTGDLVGGFFGFGAQGASSPTYQNLGGLGITTTGSSTNNLGGQLNFYTKADGGSLTQHLSLDNSGILSVTSNTSEQRFVTSSDSLFARFQRSTTSDQFIGKNNVLQSGGTGKAVVVTSGANRYLQGSDAGLPTGSSVNLTFSEWFKWTSGSVDVLFNYGTNASTNTLGFYITGTTGVLVTTAGSPLATVSVGTLNDGNWHNIVVVVSGSTLTVYVDNVAHAGTAVTAYNIILSGVFQNYQSTTAVDGALDQELIYNRALSRTSGAGSTDEIGQIYAGGLGTSAIPTSGLIRRYEFEEGNGATTTADTNPNGTQYPLTLINGVTWTQNGIVPISSSSTESPFFTISDGVTNAERGVAAWGDANGRNQQQGKWFQWFQNGNYPLASNNTGQWLFNPNNTSATVPTIVSTIDVAGNMTIGATYAGVNAAPTNGLLVQGNVGIGTTSPVGTLSLGGNQTAAAWGTSGIDFHTTAATYTDSSTAATGTVTTGATNAFAIPTLAATNSSVTYTNYSTLYVAGAPAAGSHVTITNPLALQVAAGNAAFGGNVGIGTTSPTHLLEVDGTGNGNLTAGAFLLPTLINGNYVGISFGKSETTNNAATLTYVPSSTAANSYANLAVFGNAGLTVNGNGYVGIGTTSPSTFLNVSGSTAGTFTSVATFTNTFASSVTQTASFLAPNASTGGVGTGPYFTFGVANTNNNSAAFQFTYTAAGSANNFLGLGIYGTSSALNVFGSGVGIGTGTSVAPTNGLIVAGNVGIGTTSPSGTLSLAGSKSVAAWGTTGINFNTAAATYTDTSTAGLGTVTSTAINSFGIPTAAATNSSVTYTNYSTLYVAGAPVAGPNAIITNPFALRIASGNAFFGGNVGISNAGTPFTPGFTLQVGDSSVSGIVARFQNSTGTCDINPTNTALQCSSDMNLKKNINNLSDNSAWSFNTNITAASTSDLDKILALNPVNYNWNAEQNTDAKHVGFIAQEVQQIFPDLVATDPNTHLLSLNYIGFIPYTIEAIKEMNIKVTSIDDLTKANTWRDALITWFADSANGIKSLVVHDQICVDDQCLTKTDIQKLLQLENQQGGTITVTNPPASSDSTSSSDTTGSSSTGDTSSSSDQTQSPTVTDPAPSTDSSSSSTATDSTPSSTPTESTTSDSTGSSQATDSTPPPSSDTAPSQ